MSGYSEGGASLNKKTLKSWLPNHLSAKSDIDRNLNTLRNRAHDLSINSALGAACVESFVTGVVNSGLRLFPRINAKELGMTPRQVYFYINHALRKQAVQWEAETNDGRTEIKSL